MRRPKQILKYETAIFDNTTPPLVTLVGNSTWGSTGARQTGSYIAVWGTLVSESWTTGTKDITSVETVYSTISADSIIQVSLQNTALSASSATVGILIPTGSLLATWTGSTTDYSINTISTHSFFSPHTVTTGSFLAVVWEYVSRSAALPSLGVRSFTTRDNADAIFGASIKSSTASAWVSPQNDYFANVRFRCSDNSLLYFQNGYLGMATSSQGASDFSSATTGTGIDGGDERGMLWIPKKTYDIVEYRIGSRLVDANSQTTFQLYRDTTLLASATFDSSSNISTSNRAAYGKTLDNPIRVYPNDNIRITARPDVGNTRWDRISLSSENDLKIFFGGDEYENNLSVTNRVDGGAWNTPTGATVSFTPVQFYGYEVTGANLLSGSAKLSGSVTLGGSPVSGALVRAIRRTDYTSTTASSDVNGTYQFNVQSGNYHVVVEYTSGSQKYNALSSWDVNSV